MRMMEEADAASSGRPGTDTNWPISVSLGLAVLVRQRWTKSSEKTMAGALASSSARPWYRTDSDVQESDDIQLTSLTLDQSPYLPTAACTRVQTCLLLPGPEWYPAPRVDGQRLKIHGMMCKLACGRAVWTGSLHGEFGTEKPAEPG